jgi:hypothetical protein
VRKPLRLFGLVAVAALIVPASAAAWHASFPRSTNIVPMGELASAADRPASQFNSDFAFWRNYAFLGAYDRFRIVDISNPQAPVQVSSTMCGQSQGDVTISPDGNILVRSQDSGRVLPNNDPAQACHPGLSGSTQQGWEGLQIFDVSNKANPQFVKGVFTDFGSHTHTQYYDRANNRLIIYVSRGGTREGSGGGYSAASPNPYGGQNWPATHGCITAVEVPIAAPQNAQVVNRCIAAGDAPVSVSSGGCHDVMVYEGFKRLYGACRPYMILWDISDPVNPTVIHRQQYPNINGWHSAGMSWDGKLLFAGWEPGGGSAPRCMPTGTLLDPANPGTSGVQTDEMKTIFVWRASDGALVGRWVLPREQTRTENCTIHNYAMVPYVDRHVMVQGSYQSGSSVIDFTGSPNGQEIAWVDPPPLTPTQLGGSWSTHWYNGLIYESDIPRGFAIYDVLESWWDNAVRVPYLNPQTMGERLTCRVTATGALRARRAGTIRATVRVNGQTVPGMNVRLRGAGVSRTLEANGNGVAVARLTARRAGQITVTASELNVAPCTTTRRVAAAPRPPRPAPELTGRPS